MKHIANIFAAAATLAAASIAQAQTESPPIQELNAENAIVCGSYRYQLSTVLELSKPEMSKEQSLKAERWIAYIQQKLDVDRSGALREMGRTVYAFEKKFQQLQAGNETAEKELREAGPLCGMMEYDYKTNLDAAVVAIGK